MKLPPIMRTTTFRLAVVHAFLFTFFTLGLLIYLYFSTAYYLRSQSNSELDAEMRALAAAYVTGGLERLNQSVIERSSVPGPFFYVLQDVAGEPISGDFPFIPGEAASASESRKINFDYQARNRNGEIEDRQAEGVVIGLQDGANLMIAYDLGTRRQFVSRITQTIWTALPIGLALSLIGGFVVSRWAARRVETLNKTTEGVMAGDLSLRAPVIGSGDEFDRLSERLNAMLDRLEHLIGMTRHAGDAIAHDLRSPLTRLRNRLESDLSNPGSDQTETIEKAIHDVDGVLQTFNAILSLSRVQAGNTSRFSDVDISEVLEELGELYDPAAELAEHEFAMEIDAGLEMQGDRSLIAQAVTNLLDNAIKYTPKGGALTLRGRMTRKGELEVSVTDTGPGIPEADRARATQRFVRLEASRTQAGNGLGLTMVAAIANLHGGELLLEEGPGEPPLQGLRAALVFPTE